MDRCPSVFSSFVILVYVGGELMHYQDANILIMLLNFFIPKITYQNKKGTIEYLFPPNMQTTAANYRNIMFRPDQFQEILLDKVCIKYFKNSILSLFS